MPPITILLADDHALVRRGFRRLLDDEPDLQVVAEASDGIEAVQLAQEFRPSVAVLDMAMPRFDGLQATREIRKLSPATAVLILSMYSEEHYVRNALDAGATGYLLKNALDVDLADAVRAVAAGRTILAPGLAPTREPADDSLDRLTPREKQVLQLIAQGHSNKEIAGLLSLSVNTVAVHRANLMEALNIHRTAELVLYAIRKGLLTPP